MVTRITYHPKAQAEFDQLLASGGAVVELCLLIAIGRNDRIYDGSKPLTHNEKLGKGRLQATLYVVEFTMAPFTWVEYVYEEFGDHVVVLAIDATLGGAPLVIDPDGDAKQRARQRSLR